MINAYTFFLYQTVKKKINKLNVILNLFKVFYYDDRNNDEGEELLIPMCGNPCKLKDFIQRINERFSTDWEKECEQVES